MGSRIISWLLYFLFFCLFWQTRIAPFGKNQFVDYLIPFVYLTDILILFATVLALLFFQRNFLSYLGKIFKTSKLIIVLWSLFVGSVIFSNLRAQNQLIAWFDLLKILNFSFFALTLSFLITESFIKLERLFLSFNLGLLLEGVLAVGEFIKQGSLGWQFFGEWSFSVLTPGISKVLIGNEFILRPYATFPHPNVLGSIMTAFALANLCVFLSGREKRRLANIFFFLFFSFVAFLSFSRMAWLTFFILFFITIYVKRTKVQSIISSLPTWFFLASLLAGLLAVSASTLYFITERFLSLADTDYLSLNQRIDLAKASFNLIRQSLFQGVGLSNFILNLKPFGTLLFPNRLFQPVHNVWLLITTEIGIPGLLFFIAFLVVLLRKLILSLQGRRENELKSLGLITLIFFSAFFLTSFTDHFWWTLEAGRIFFWLTVGLALV